MQKKTISFLIAVTVFLFLVINSSAQAAWIHDYGQAIEDAKKYSRPILINFTGSDWCGWCFRLKEEVFSKSAFKNYASNNLILLELDFPRKKSQLSNIKQQNNNLAKKYKIRGYPTIILINEKGDVIAKTGYKRGGSDKYIKHLKNLLSH